MTSFEPIAIVGQGCVLPGALSPDALSDVVFGKSLVYGSVSPSSLDVPSGSRNGQKFVSGRVSGFEQVFDPSRARLKSWNAGTLDPVCAWPLYAALEAWKDAGTPKVRPTALGVFVANLSYPSAGHVAYASEFWRGGQPGQAERVLTSELPAFVIAEALKAKGPCLALDAACASSLYAIDIACRRLQNGAIDCAVVAGVNATDNLILHIGFKALNAISQTGRSRPFVQGADGLVPSEGAAAIILKRVQDVEPGEKVYGLIRGTGLSNDGRRKGLLAPSDEGQKDALQRAYVGSGIQPKDIQFLECHATGTPVGDGVELEAAADFFKGAGRLPIGSLKANTGHLITVAGLASLLKLTAAMEREELPPTPVDGDLIAGAKAGVLGVLTTAENWPAGAGPRRAGLSNFGFGGNNAHLILEEYKPVSRPARSKPSRTLPVEDVVICGVGLMAGSDRNSDAVLRRLMNQPVIPPRPMAEIGADAAGARVPPRDLAEAEPQQLAILSVVNEAFLSVEPAAKERTGVFTAMTCAADSARWPFRERCDTDANADLDAIVPALNSAMVMGAMANMTANRITYARDLEGMGFAVSAGTASSAAVLDLALVALQSGTLDLAIVAAADFAAEPVRAAALRDLEGISRPGDMAAALVLKRRSAAEAAGDHIFGTLNAVEWASRRTKQEPVGLADFYGAAPVAEPLADLAISCQLQAHSHVLEHEGAVLSLVPARTVRSIHAKAHQTAGASAILWEPAPPRILPDRLRPPPFFFYAAASTYEKLAERIEDRKPGGRGKARIAVVHEAEEGFEAALRQAVKALKRQSAPSGAGVYFGEGTPEGELALVFTGSAAVYPRAARRLLMALPEIGRKLSSIRQAQEIAKLLSHSVLSEYEQLCTGTLVSQAHAILLLDIMEVEPDAALGLSLGESNALFAFGFWDDPGALLKDISAAAMYERHLGGEFETARQAWGPNVPSDWTNWRIQAPVDAVRAILPKYPSVEITIVYTDTDCMIGGPADACRALARCFGEGAGAKMSQHLIVHAKAMKPFEETWRKLHTRPVCSKPSVRLYANAIHGAYEPTAESAADMLTRQAVDTVEFPPTVRQAWDDGVRTFVELGPRDTLTASIASILDGKPFKAAAMDRIEKSDLGQVAEVAALLFAEGRKINLSPLLSALETARRNMLTPTKKWTVMRPVPYPAPKVPQEHQKTDIPFPEPPRLRVPDYAKAAAPAPVAQAPAIVPKPIIASGNFPDKVVCGRRPLPSRKPIGPAWTRQEIEASTRGSMSEFFGAEFKCQDDYVRQVRLPAPPLLLVDRITGIDALPGEDAKGIIWTETDLSSHLDFIHDGRIRPGPLIECGQADLTLIGWMGADFRNKDERVYRLLGCEITFHDGGLPEAASTLRFQIEITGHAELSGVRMFFFQYDCKADDRLAFSVRQGQAGFFTDEELAAGKGVIWDAARDKPPTAMPTPFGAERASARRHFTAEQVDAFRRGDAFACFGEGFEACAAHSNPPRGPSGKLALFDEVEAFEPLGGPWGRGYLRATAHTPASAWFYDGHFHNDPCMPGTLMAEAAVQALEFHAAALGLTVERDGYVFEPVPGHTAKFVCRGQVVPDADHEVTYEVFVDEVIDGDTPEIYASILARSDGKKVFYCPRFGIRLRRNWKVPRISTTPRAIGPLGESRGDEETLLECADGAPSAAFGDMYRKFDSESIVPRLPQPPYHFVSRVTSVSSRPGTEEPGAWMTAEYDIPADAWYFDDNLNGQMPFAVLAEIALQPCGWLASHSGFAVPGGLRFRNLEGDGVLFEEVLRSDQRLDIRSELTNISKAGPMTLVSFDVQVDSAARKRVLDLKTQFGFFPASALVRQAGLAAHPEYAAAFNLPRMPAPSESHGHDLVTGRLRMLDEIDYYDPAGGVNGLGIIRGQQYVDPNAWYFKAHFYQDPVQPGSLGLDALTQLLCRMVWLKGLADGMKRPHLSTLATNAPIRWSYRGQVTPDRKQVTSVMEIQSVEQRDNDILITARGSLWRDGLRVYEVKPICVSLKDLG
ncbi:MAG: beta-ketoacyl synthase N-terminal-like domain-containing protein [Hyphomonas sp.]|uniref:beta-ketoacyl synthase N-terminal-like domain-containing protein n=1 Tax=Hyphomonas sp. TaxID=87 RepID=UPI00352785F7